MVDIVDEDAADERRLFDGDDSVDQHSSAAALQPGDLIEVRYGAPEKQRRHADLF